mgnify:CR=1 FL=1
MNATMSAPADAMRGDDEGEPSSPEPPSPLHADERAVGEPRAQPPLSVSPGSGLIGPRGSALLGRLGDGAFGGGGLKVRVEDGTGELGAGGERALAAIARAAVGEAARAAGVAGGVVEVRVVGDGEMSRVHGLVMGSSGTTDVVSFDLTGGRALEAGRLEAEAVVCLDEARRQACGRGHGVVEELVLYVLHGVLHGLGFDDGTAAAGARMHGEEDRVLSAIGLGAVYGVGGGADVEDG